jgi:hypothetical protein
MTPFPGTPIYWRALRENLLVRGHEMTYEDWNSYTATMRTYKLNLSDLKRARLWARLETYVPYTWGHVKNEPAKQKARGMLHLAPRVAVLGALRAYAAWKLRAEERADPSLRQQPTSSAVGVRLRVLPVSAGTGGTPVSAAVAAPTAAETHE